MTIRRREAPARAANFVMDVLDGIVTSLSKSEKNGSNNVTILQYRADP
jgi:hypothetical protein